MIEWLDLPSPSYVSSSMHHDWCWCVIHQRWHAPFVPCWKCAPTSTGGGFTQETRSFWRVSKPMLLQSTFQHLQNTKNFGMRSGVLSFAFMKSILMGSSKIETWRVKQLSRHSRSCLVDIAEGVYKMDRGRNLADCCTRLLNWFLNWHEKFDFSTKNQWTNTWCLETSLSLGAFWTFSGVSVGL